MPEPAARVTEEPSSTPAPVSLPDTLTVGGETYENPVYRSHNEFSLNIAHETGVASVLIANLSPSLQAKLGFDREAAASAQAAFAELQNQATKQHIENQVRDAQRREELAEAAQPTAKQAKPQGLDLSHRSLNGGSAIWTDEVAANLFDLNGKIISVRFIPTARHGARQRADGFYEINVLPDGSDIIVRIPVEIGRKWFSVNSYRNMPKRLIVRVDVGELENVYGTVREGAVLTALGTKVRRGFGTEEARIEW